MAQENHWVVARDMTAVTALQDGAEFAGLALTAVCEADSELLAHQTVLCNTCGACHHVSYYHRNLPFIINRNCN